MTHAAVARWLLALLCGAQGAGTVVIDLNRTHASNPLWPPHARFHLVWQAVSYAMLAFAEVALVLTSGPFQEQRFYLAAILAAIPMIGCLAAFLFRRIYGGDVHNPDGIQPFRISAFGSEFQLDLNLTAEAMALILLAAIVLLFRH